MRQICEISCTSSVYHTVWKIPNHGGLAGQQVQSEVFHGYSQHGSDCKVSWHYVLEVTRSEQLEDFIVPGDITLHSVVVMVVVDSCTDRLKAVAELVQDPRKGYKISGITEAGSEFGRFTVDASDYLKYFDTLGGDQWVRLRLNFHLVEIPESQSTQDSQLEENYLSLLTNEELSDVTIQVGPEKFYAQRAILSVRSSVFAAMFQSGMKEAKLNHLIVEDIEPEVFKELLRFIYVEKVERLDDMAHQLLAAADKYALDKLRIMCERHIRDHMTLETVFETLILADLYDAQELKDQAIRLFCLNVDALMLGTEWTNLKNSHPDLARALMRALDLA